MIFGSSLNLQYLTVLQGARDTIIRCMENKELYRIQCPSFDSLCH